MTTATASAPETTGVGTLLREWRDRRRISQLELALRADSSARHISFVETGRSRPSQEMVLRLAEHLDVPVRERNALLIAAGYAPAFPETPLDDPSMSALRAGMERLLAGYDPYPALVVDGMYHVQATNQGLGVLLDGVDPELLHPPVNALRLTLHPRGMAPRIRNFPEWREHLFAQLDRQLALMRSAPLRALHDELRSYPLPDREREAPAAGEHPPFALPLVIEHRGTVLSFLSTIATFNTPMDVTVSELALEAFLPADPETAAYLRKVAG
ncbi:MULTISPECIES: helix-turn-helix domain-containing protein [unclassified Streptomyces]|uniref:helix-turn-helix domain-containing protein n=1 Tax=unclassified Streptomyces TaxID=2593676 RepID=UPI000C274DF4|nr:helix-turn-helix transcriptional regulator [Streptomyces sp. CB02959]PJN37967.1 transcriptional regulator [Streptomyces sp. CB02959]